MALIEVASGDVGRGQAVGIIGDGTPQHIFEFGEALAGDGADKYVRHVRGQCLGQSLYQFVVQHVAFAYGQYAVLVYQLGIEML